MEVSSRDVAALGFERFLGMGNICAIFSFLLVFKMLATCMVEMLFGHRVDQLFDLLPKLSLRFHPVGNYFAGVDDGGMVAAAEI